MLGTQRLVTFVATRDSARALAFYRDALGLLLVSDEPYAIVFDAHGTTLRIQKVDSFEPQPFTALGWQVSDVDAVVDALSRNGVAFQRYPGLEHDARGIWSSPAGARVAWFKDPDGNTLSLTQL